MRKLLILVLAVFTAIVAIAGWSLSVLLDLSISPASVLSISLFLMIIQLIIIVMLPLFVNEKQDKSVAFVSVAKLVKMGCSGVFLLVWYALDRLDTTFLLVFAAYYVLYIFYDSWMYMQLNKLPINKTISDEK